MHCSTVDPYHRCAVAAKGPPILTAHMQKIPRKGLMDRAMYSIPYLSARSFTGKSQFDAQELQYFTHITAIRRGLPSARRDNRKYLKRKTTLCYSLLFN